MVAVHCILSKEHIVLPSPAIVLIAPRPVPAHKGSTETLVNECKTLIKEMHKRLYIDQGKRLSHCEHTRAQNLVY